MRSHSVFQDLGRDFSRLERPGYWQNRSAVLLLARMTRTGADACRANGVQRQKNTTESAKNAG